MIHQNFHNVVTLKGAFNNTIVSCPKTMVVSWLFEKVMLTYVQS